MGLAEIALAEVRFSAKLAELVCECGHEFGILGVVEPGGIPLVRAEAQLAVFIPDLTLRFRSLFEELVDGGEFLHYAVNLLPRFDRRAFVVDPIVQIRIANKENPFGCEVRFVHEPRILERGPGRFEKIDAVCFQEIASV